MRKIVFRVTVFIAVLIPLFFMFAPEERVNSVQEGWRRLTKDTGQLCLDYERLELKDPEGARLISTGFKDDIFFIVYKAKNSYGTYGTLKGICSFSDGKVDPLGSRVRLETLVLDEQVKCLNTRKKIRDQGGRPDADGGPTMADCERGPSAERVKHSAQ